MSLRQLIKAALNAGVHASDDDFRTLGKRMFNADCIVGAVLPWISFITLEILGQNKPAMFWVNAGFSLVYAICWWLQWKGKPLRAILVYIVTLAPAMALCVLAEAGFFALPLLFAVLILSMVSLIPHRIKETYWVGAGFLVFGGSALAFNALIPLDLPEWIVSIRDLNVLSMILASVFLYKSFLFILLYSYNYQRFRKNHETAMEHKGRYNTLFDNALEGLLVLEEETGKILDANPSALEMFGYTGEQIRGLRLQDLFVEPINDSMSLPEQLQTMARDHTGKGFYVEFSHFPLNPKNAEKTVLSIRNIHDRVLSDLQRVQNQIRYQRIFDTNALGIQETDMSILSRDLTLLRAKGVTDLEAYIAQNPEQLQTWLASTQITDVNQALLHLIGAPNKEYLLQNLPEFLTEQAFDAFIRETLAIWNGATHFTGEIEIRKASGDIRVLQYTTNFPTDGNFEHLVYTYVDITDIRRQQGTIEEQVALLNEKNIILQRYIESNMQLENFAYVASHDLQTPLRAIMGFTQVLQEELADRMTDEEATYFGHIVNATNNMNKLIEDLLIFSRVNSRRAVWDKVDLTRVLDNLLIELQPAVEESGALIKFNDLPTSVNGDATRLRQLFQNLLTNALKFRSPDVTPLIQVSCTKQKRFWLFSVKDNGIGVAPEFQDRIFLLFQKLHTPQEYKGTGIGLSLCKTIVEQHGGTLWLDSREGQGSTFHFTLAIEPELLDVTPAQSEPSVAQTAHEN